MKEGHLYAELAAFGQVHGYPVTPPVVHLWAHRRLLPSCRVERLGFGKTRTDLDPEAETRLLAICRYRFDERVGRLDWIAALLWLDGNDLSVELVREALRNEVRRHGATGRLGWPRGKQLDETAMSAADWAPIVAILPGVDRATRADQIFAILQALTDPHRGDASPDLVASIAQATGATHDWIRSLLGSRPPAPDPRAAIEAPDEIYEAARVAWRAELHVVWPASRSTKPRLQVRRQLAGFMSALITTHIAIGSRVRGQS